MSCRYVAPGFEPVREAFEQNFEDGLELGAAFAAFRDDELIVDLRGGKTDRKGDNDWTARTLCPFCFSDASVSSVQEQSRLDLSAGLFLTQPRPSP